jgi:hypothetical protein
MMKQIVLKQLGNKTLKYEVISTRNVVDYIVGQILSSVEVKGLVDGSAYDIRIYKEK